MLWAADEGRGGNKRSAQRSSQPATTPGVLGTAGEGSEQVEGSAQRFLTTPSALGTAGEGSKQVEKAGATFLAARRIRANFSKVSVEGRAGDLFVRKLPAQPKAKSASQRRIWTAIA
jgi:hypothetical protein